MIHYNQNTGTRSTPNAYYPGNMRPPNEPAQYEDELEQQGNLSYTRSTGYEDYGTLPEAPAASYAYPPVPSAGLSYTGNDSPYDSSHTATGSPYGFSDIANASRYGSSYALNTSAYRSPYAANASSYGSSYPATTSAHGSSHIANTPPTAFRQEGSPGTIDPRIFQSSNLSWTSSEPQPGREELAPVHEIPAVHQESSRFKLSEEDTERCLDLYSEGRDIEYIAKELKVDKYCLKIYWREELKGKHPKVVKDLSNLKAKNRTAKRREELRQGKKDRGTGRIEKRT